VADLTITPLGNGAYRVDTGDRSRIAYTAATADARWIFLDGHVYIVEAERGSGTRKRTRSHDEGALASPMPATVISITVEPGQRVSRGDVLIMLEAMKMELPIKAPRDATVKSIGCRTGELVQPGVPLLELE